MAVLTQALSLSSCHGNFELPMETSWQWSSQYVLSSLASHLACVPTSWTGIHCAILGWSKKKAKVRLCVIIPMDVMYVLNSDLARNQRRM